MHVRQTLLLAMASWLLPGGAFAETVLRGQVTDPAGSPWPGAMVSLANEAGSHRLTVYSDREGAYEAVSPFSGKVRVRLRTPHHRDRSVNIELEADGIRELNLVAGKPLAPAEASERLQASAHAARLAWPDEAAKETFISQCNFCHQVGNELTRRPRPLQEWEKTVERMEGYLAVLLTEEQADTIAHSLHDGFTGESITRGNSHKPYHEQLPAASFEEWLVGDGMSFIHDAEVGSDGHFYGADEGHDVIWELDPATGEVTEHRLPEPPDMNTGGKFEGLRLPIGIFTGKHGPHSLAEDDNGVFWITNSLSSYLISFDTKTHEFRQFELQGDELYPHTIRIGADGMIWFTNAASNQVTRFNPDKEQFRTIDLPSNGFAHWMTDAFLPMMLEIASWWPGENVHLSLSHHKWAGLGRDVMSMPYGIDISPVDGRIWYAKLLAHKIGVIDPETLEITEYDTPLHGPRRPRFDDRGRLWIPAFDDSGLMRFDPETESFTTWRIPALAPGEWETPYALNVHPQTQAVWITSNNSDRIFRFDPDSETFTSYPSPTRVTFLRDLVFNADGEVCSSQSNLPAYAIEGGRPSFLCLDPGL